MENKMARIDHPTDDMIYRLGMTAATSTTPNARVEAHKWFNIAAMHGNEKAAQLRREIAEEMSSTEIAAAQRAAREWVTVH
jgi:uncharacterized protein